MRDAKTLRKRWSGRAEPAVLLSLRFSLDGKRLFVSGRDRLATSWDVASGQVERQVVDESGVTWSGSVSPDGQLLATASATSRVYLFDMRTGRRVRSLAAHDHMCYGVSFSPDGRWLVSTGVQEAFAWDLEFAPRSREAEARLAGGGDLERARYLAMRDAPAAALRLMERAKVEGPEKELLAKRVQQERGARRKVAPLRLDPSTPYAKAIALLDKGDAKGAEEALTAMAAKNPADGMTQFQLAKARLALGKREDARTALDAAVRSMPDWSTGWVVRGELRGRSGDDAGALEDLRKAVTLDPKSTHALSALAEQHGRHRRWQEAVGAWNQAIALAPRRAWYVHERAKARAALRDYPAVVADCELLVKLAPRAGMSWFARGEAYELVGRLEEAQRDLEKAIELAAGMEGPKIARERVMKKRGTATPGK